MKQVQMMISFEEQDDLIKIRGRLSPDDPALEETVSPEKVEETVAGIIQRLLEQTGLKVTPAAP